MDMVDPHGPGPWQQEPATKQWVPEHPSDYDTIKAIIERAIAEKRWTVRESQWDYSEERARRVHIHREPRVEFEEQSIEIGEGYEGFMAGFTFNEKGELTSISAYE